MFYAGAAAIAAGHSPYVGDFVSPPWFALALIPLTWLPLSLARGAWLALNLVLLVLTTAGSARLVALRWPARRILLAALIFALWPPIEFGLRLGQSSLLVWALIVAALLAARGGRFGLAGALLGLALVKPQLVVLFGAGVGVWAARQRGLLRYLGAGLGVLAALALLVLLVAPGAYGDLLSLQPRTWNYWGSTVALPPLLAQITGSQPAGVAAYLPLAIAGSLALLREWARQPTPYFAYLAGLTAVATLLLTPYAYPYDAILLQVPALWLIARCVAPSPLAWRPGPLLLVAALACAWWLERPGDYTMWRFLGLLPPLAVVLALVASRRALS